MAKEKGEPGKKELVRSPIVVGVAKDDGVVIVEVGFSLMR